MQSKLKILSSDRILTLSPTIYIVSEKLLVSDSVSQIIPLN